MIRAYDKSYLATAQKNLARMLDYLVNNLHYPLETAWQGIALCWWACPV